MTKKQKKTVEVVPCRFRIDSKFTEFVFCPMNAVDSGFYSRTDFRQPVHFVTKDGVECVPEFVSGWNNEDGRYDGRFDELCQEHYGFPFRSIRSIWVSRLGRVENYWHLIKLTKI